MSKRPKVMVLWQGASGYFASCLKALADEGCEIHLVLQGNSKDVAFSFSDFVHPSINLYRYEEFSRISLKNLHDSINPELLLVSSWHIFKYVSIARRSRSLRVLCMDNQWHGTIKQRLGVLGRYFLIQRNYDVAFVPGDRQRKFANLLGFSDSKIWVGLYSADTQRFLDQTSERELEFIFVGRLVAQKGITNLIDAYKLYRANNREPLSLRVCGTGPYEESFEGIPGVIMSGFIQPENLPSIFGKSSIMIIPSEFEPWGVVIHEACASGLFIICTFECGAAFSLVEDGWNGRIIPSGDSFKLMNAMQEAHQIMREDSDLISARSRSIAARYTPELWAQNILRRFQSEFQSIQN